MMSQQRGKHGFAHAGVCARNDDDATHLAMKTGMWQQSNSRFIRVENAGFIIGRAFAKFEIQTTIQAC